MPFNVTSSSIGVDLNNTSTTALFALGTKVMGTNNTEWTYVQATGVLQTGEFAVIRAGGTCVTATTLTVNGANAGGLAYEFGWSQGNFAALDFGWLAKRGDSVTVLMSGTCVPNQQLYLSCAQGVGCLVSAVSSATMLGIQLNASSSTASLVLQTAIITWPRCVLQLS